MPNTAAQSPSVPALAVGDAAPNFAFPPSVGLPDLAAATAANQAVVVYFYPKDDTPGCTKQACGFRDNLPHFATNQAIVVGISRDSEGSHAKFIEKFALNFPLVSDHDGSICAAYGTWVEKSMYGKIYMGIERATFLVGTDGRIAAIWRKVKVDGHAEQVLAKLQQLQG
jgi:peroxiredoxin Q/BCP